MKEAVNRTASFYIYMDNFLHKKKADVIIETLYDSVFYEKSDLYL